jgi:hypothetical protein
MDGPMSTQPEYFLDTAFAIALASKSDVFHQDAIELAKSLKTTRARPDKEWGLTDCVSFVVMQQMSITDALTTDDHFRQAGFRVLLA